jgi:flagellar basal-body rod modification protein FlgD
MATIPSSTTTTATTAATSPQQLVNPKGLLDKDDFLKLMMAQLKQQDPMSPMDNDQMVAQMSQLSTVEQLTNMASANSQMARAIASSSAIGLIGRTVSWTDAEDAVHSGVVESVSTKDGVPSLTVGGTAGVDPSSITQVA